MVQISASFGSLLVDPDTGLASYTPDSPLADADEFQYSAADGLVMSDPVTISLLADEDADGLANIDEQAIGTDPLDPDSDDDGLLDGVEANPGVFASASDTGTDPLAADSDGDGRNDGDEVAAGTDPNVPDRVFLPALGLWGRAVLLLALTGSAATGLRFRRRGG